jgi:hypothetical protein
MMRARIQGGCPMTKLSRRAALALPLLAAPAIACAQSCEH